MADQVTSKAQEAQEAPPVEAAQQEPEPEPESTVAAPALPTVTESAPAPEPAAEPVVAAAATDATAPATESAPAAPEPVAAAAATATATEAAPTPTPAPETESEQPAAAETTAGKNEPAKPEYFTKTPALEKLFDSLPTILSSTGHNEMWGVPLKHDAADVPTLNVLIKFLRANEGNAKLAEEQLTKALAWRKELDPLALVDASKNSYDAAKFGGMGYLTTYEREGKADLIVTWNIYGAVKNIDETFGDLTEFIKWRVALMELAVQELKLDEATSIIDYNGEDPYQMIQVHDYLNVSFLRLNPTIRAATKKTIEVFSTAYPELLREKFFINVPLIMGWMFSLMKLFVNENTSRKFHPISNGANLAKEFPGLVEKFPKSYGGDAAELEGSARTVALTSKESSA
ncbi:CRAL-TRIO domain-containing protein [Aspergillus californicus]